MHLKIRNSSTKRRKKNGFRRQMKTKAGRVILNRQRRRAMGKPKHTRSLARKGKGKKSPRNWKK
jgi:ribosomal protein L34